MTLPNQLTVLRMALTPVFAFALIQNELHFKYAALGIFIFAALTDWYDGYIARKHNAMSQAGKYLDPLADKILVSTAFFIFAFLNYMPFWMFWIIVLRDAVITLLRWYAVSAGKKFETTIYAKWKTAAQMFVIYFLLIWIILEKKYLVGINEPKVLHLVIEWDLVWSITLLVTVYTLLTGIIYLFENQGHLKNFAIACYRVFVPTNVR